MSKKSKIILHSLNASAANDCNNINDYRLLKLNAYQGQHSWDFLGRDGAHGPYPFPYRGMKQLVRKV